MEIGPARNNEALRKGTNDSPARQKGAAEGTPRGDKRDPDKSRAELADLADRTLHGNVNEEIDSYAAGTVDAVETAAEEAQLYDQLAGNLAAGRAAKGLVDRAASGDAKLSRLELIRQRIDGGFYDSRSVKEIIAQKLADEFEGSKPQQNEIEDDS